MKSACFKLYIVDINSASDGDRTTEMTSVTSTCGRLVIGSSQEKFGSDSAILVPLPQSEYLTVVCLLWHPSCTGSYRKRTREAAEYIV